MKKTKRYETTFRGQKIPHPLATMGLARPVTPSTRVSYFDEVVQLALEEAVEAERARAEEEGHTP